MLGLLDVIRQISRGNRIDARKADEGSSKRVIFATGFFSMSPSVIGHELLRDADQQTGKSSSAAMC